MKSESKYGLEHYVFCIYEPMLMFLMQSAIFYMLITIKRPAINILRMLLFCLSFFPSIQYASPPVVSMDILIHQQVSL